jgi:hypothetical protein
VVANDLDCLLHAASACDDILRDEKALARADFKSSPQHESSVAVLLGEDVFLPEMAGDFLADNDAADSGRNHDIGFEGFQLFGEQSADVRGDGGILQKQGALEELAAVQTAAEHEMAVQEGSGAAEKIEDFAHEVGPIFCSFQPRR